MIGILVIVVGVLVFIAWKAEQSMSRDRSARSSLSPESPSQYLDPWETVLSKEELEEIFSDRYPLCVNCVHPDSAPVWFCEQCGSPTGHYTPYMPFLRVFWIGWLFRSGVDGSVKLTRFRIVGLVVSSIHSFGVFVPLYIYRLIRSAKGKHLIERRPPKGVAESADVD